VLALQFVDALFIAQFLAPGPSSTSRRRRRLAPCGAGASMATIAPSIDSSAGIATISFDFSRDFFGFDRPQAGFLLDKPFPTEPRRLQLNSAQP
jgi:hypothetical protein